MERELFFFLILMEFERIIMEQRHRKTAKYLTIEANGLLTGSHGLQNWALVIEGTFVACPVCHRGKDKFLQVTPAIFWETEFLLRLKLMGSTSRSLVSFSLEVEPTGEERGPRGRLMLRPRGADSSGPPVFRIQ